jgi:hypothetical protein
MEKRSSVSNCSYRDESRRAEFGMKPRPRHSNCGRNEKTSAIASNARDYRSRVLRAHTDFPPHSDRREAVPEASQRPAKCQAVQTQKPPPVGDGPATSSFEGEPIGRCLPAMVRGLVHCADGGQFDADGNSLNGGRRLAGWSGKHWILQPPTRALGETR